MPVIGCLEIFQNGRSPQPITGIIYSPGCHELKIGSAGEDTLGFIPLVSCLGLRFHCLSIKLENPLDITETDHMRLPCLAKKPQSIKQKTLAYIT